MTKITKVRMFLMLMMALYVGFAVLEDTEPNLSLIWLLFSWSRTLGLSWCETWFGDSRLCLGHEISVRCTGCPKKNARLRLTGHKGHQEWTRDKSRVSFAKFRKFSFWWAQKLLKFVRKWLRNMSSKMPTPLEKRHECGSSWRYFYLSNLIEKIDW